MHFHKSAAPRPAFKASRKPMKVNQVEAIVNVEKRQIMLFSKMRADKFYLVKVRRWIEFETGYTITKAAGNFHPLFFIRNVHRSIMLAQFLLYWRNWVMHLFFSAVIYQNVWSSPFYSNHQFLYWSMLVDCRVSKLQRLLESYKMLIESIDS